MMPNAARRAPSGAAPIAIAVSAIGLVALLRAHANALLSASIDPISPDWDAMRRAFGAYSLYAVGVVGVIAIALSWIGARLLSRGADRVSGVRTAALAVAIATGMVLTLVDVLIFQDYGIHFYEFNVFGILGDAALRRDLGIQPAQVATVTLAAALVLAVEIGLILGASRLATWRNGVIARASTIALCTAALLGLVMFRAFEKPITNVRADFEEVLPLGRTLLLRESIGPHIQTSPRLGRAGYATVGAESAPVLSRKPNIVFFVPDGLRADMVTPALAPNLTAFGARPDVIHSRRHFSTGHVSEAGIFGLAYGVDAQAYHAFLEARVPSYPMEVLRRNGYRTLFLASSRINPYPSDQLLRLFDDVEYPPNDDAAVATLARYVDARRRDHQPYFVLAFFYTPHYPFTSAKPSFQRYPLVGPSSRTNYMNDVLQADDYFRQTFDLVRDDFEHGRTIVLATSDHGEEIRDHGVFGHAPDTFWNEKILVPFFLGLPGASLGAAQSPERSSHVDVWPTIFDYLGASAAMPPTSYSDGRSLLKAADTGRVVYVYGRYFPEADRPSVLIQGNRKYWFRVAGVSLSGELCPEVTKVTDLEDRTVASGSADAATLHAFNGLQADFWRFIQPTESSQSRPANCTTFATSFHGASDGSGNRLSQEPGQQRGRTASHVRSGAGGP